MTTPPLASGDTRVLRMAGIHKSFFGVRVLDDIALELRRGEVLALLGENGAGKSTLIKILNGDYTKDAGEIYVGGERVVFSEPRDAEGAGIRMIYQELHYAPDLSVAENMFIGHLPRRGGPLGPWFVDWGEVYERARRNLALLEVNVDPTARMGDLSVVERQIVEIVKAVSAEARILVMDEPTAALTPHEVDRLFELVRQLKERGVAIIYVSHRLDEIFQIADRVQVLRDGRHVATRPIGEVTPKGLVDMMVGRELEDRSASAHKGASPDNPVLEVRGLGLTGVFENIDLTVHRGEILGVFGLLGSGQLALTRAIFGDEPADKGEISIDSQPVRVRTPRDARGAGVGFVPIDRKVRGLVLGMSVRKNITLSNWGRLATLGFFRGREERNRARRWIDDFGIRMAGGMDVPVRLLSGGNQQKVVLSRWLEADVKVLILNEPTWGVDVGARADIYEQLERLAKGGLAVLVVSSDIDEVLTVSDRILTIYQGRLTGEFSAAHASRERLLNAAAGQSPPPESAEAPVAGGTQ